MVVATGSTKMVTFYNKWLIPAREYLRNLKIGQIVKINRYGSDSIGIIQHFNLYRAGYKKGKIKSITVKIKLNDHEFKDKITKNDIIFYGKQCELINEVWRTFFKYYFFFSYDIEKLEGFD